MSIANAVERLQAIAGQVTGVKHAPQYPVEDALTLPLCIAHLTGGESTMDDATQYRHFANLSADFHVSRISLRQAYSQIGAIADEFTARLAGDPTLAGNVDTIVFPIQYTVSPAEWDRVTTQMISFTVRVKTMSIPQAST